ncbi:MAG: hypothetical protein L0Y72_30050 [Gemmataceae bacterium]|nr:hypothetical protein [Gemmataceae bacterium]MCI0743291.1 hypothetical protein [Gemmataceae bacterium]
MRETPAPAMFLAWASTENFQFLLQRLGGQAAQPTLIQDHIEHVEGGEALPEIVFVKEGFSRLSAEQRRILNLHRDSLLAFGTKMVVVEPFEKHRALVKDLPDVFSILRQFDLTAPVFEDDFLWNTADANRLSLISSHLKLPVAKGSVIIDQSGHAHYKGPPVDICPRCGAKLRYGATQLTFKHAPVETQVQPVEGWVCPCGEKYVPGETARQAYLRAFQKSP